MKYCEFCGKPIKNKSCSCPEALAQGKKPRKISPVAIIAVIAVVAVIAVICSISVSAKVDPFEYVNVEFSGYESAGSVEVSFDDDLLITELLGEIGGSEEELGEWIVKYDAYLAGLDVSYSPKTGLSNGDTVTVTIVSSGEAKGKVQSGEQTYVVDGLPEVETIDIFKDVDVTFEGFSGEAQAEVKLLADSEILNACQFSIDKHLGLSEGDVITVSIQNVDILADTYLCVPQETSKTYTVPELAAYLTDANLLPLDTIQDFADQFVIEQTKEPEDWFTYSETTHYKTYFATLREGENNKFANALYIFVTYDEYNNDEYWRTVYTPLVFYNITKSADGSINLNYEDGNNSVFYTDMESAVEEISAGYDFVEVNIK